MRSRDLRTLSLCRAGERSLALLVAHPHVCPRVDLPRPPRQSRCRRKREESRKEDQKVRGIEDKKKRRKGEECFETGGAAAEENKSFGDVQAASQRREVQRRPPRSVCRIHSLRSLMMMMMLLLNVSARHVMKSGVVC